MSAAVFRGFLLPSLTKYMPTWAAVGLSSLAFGAAHFSPRDFPVLSALGALLGVSYVRRYVHVVEYQEGGGQWGQLCLKEGMYT
jgi:hypothetical protein